MKRIVFLGVFSLLTGLVACQQTKDYDTKGVDTDTTPAVIQKDYSDSVKTGAAPQDTTNGR